MKVGFIGLSHLGLVSAISLASKDFSVIGFDLDITLVAQLREKKLPIHEPELDNLLAKFFQKIHFTSDVKRLQECDLVYFSLDIKTDQDNVSDLSGIHSLIDDVVPQLRTDAIVVLLSQVPPGFSRGIAKKIGEERFFYQVETLIFGRAVERALAPERYIIGCNSPEKSIPTVLQNVLAAGDCPILPMKYESAELCKIAINMFLVSSVSTTNTIAEICENIGAEWGEIAPALRLDKRIGQFAYLSPGLGIAGGNLERDLITICSLSKEYNTDARVVEAWIENSKYRSMWVIRILQKLLLNKNPTAKIAIWGLAYKQDTKSIKNSPSIALIEAIPSATIAAYDPQAEISKQNFKNLIRAKSPLAACEGAEALVIMTPWKEFFSEDVASVKKRMHGSLLIDPFHVFNLENCIRSGFDYYRLGTKTI